MNIYVKCGVCGSDIHIEPSVSPTGMIEIIATCPNCKKANETIGDLEDYIHDLEGNIHDMEQKV